MPDPSQPTSASAALILQYLRADQRMRGMMRATLPDTFTDELAAAIDEADAMLAEADAAAREAVTTANTVYTDLDLPGFPAAKLRELDAAGGGIPDARSIFERTLAQMISDQLQENADEAAEAEGGDGTARDSDVVEAETLTREEALATVLPLVAELGGASAAAVLARVSRLWRHTIVAGTQSKPLWLGIAMREFGADARAALADAGGDGVFSIDWRAFVFERLATLANGSRTTTA